MIIKLNLSRAAAGAGEKDAAKSGVHDFIPYACHYDPHTLLTKNGELLQILKITQNVHGIPQELSAADSIYLRDAIRQAMARHVESDAYSFWFHTLRLKEPLHLAASFDTDFARELNVQWQRQNGWSEVFHNEVYITVLRQGEGGELLKKDNVKNGYFLQKNREQRSDYIDDGAVKLAALVRGICTSLSEHFAVEVLSLRERERGGSLAVISEPASFLARLAALSPRDIALGAQDLSKDIAQDLSFGFNSVESRGKDGKRQFASIVSLKHYQELPPERLDLFLQLPMEMVVTQAFDYLPAKEAKEPFLALQDMIRISQDDYFARVSGFSDFLAADTQNKVDYGHQQASILLISEDYAQLERDTTRLQRAISELGLVSVREDIKLEEAFWSVLPGNFEFLRRQQPIQARAVAGLCRLNYFPHGEAKSIWGDPVAVLPTSVQTPYMFHFHVGDNGHAALFDFNSFPDNLGRNLMSFLLAQATRLSPRIVMFDQGVLSAPLAANLGGRYAKIGAETSGMAFNPLAMEDTRRNRGFLLAWLGTLLGAAAEDEQSRLDLRSAIDALFQQSGEARSMARYIALLEQENAELASRLREIASSAAMSWALTDGQDQLTFDPRFSLFDMQPLMSERRQAVALFSYILHRLILELDGRPTIIVLMQAWELLDNPFFAPRLESLMEMLKEHNAMLFLASSRPEQMAQSAITPTVVQQCATRLFIPDDVPGSFYPDITGLSEQDEKLLLQMERQKGQFLIKHGEEVIPSRLRIDDPALRTGLVDDRKNAALGRRAAK